MNLFHQTRTYFPNLLYLFKHPFQMPTAGT